MPYLLEMKNITKTFGSVKAIDNVSLRLNAGEIVSLCGENGSGKSTLMKVLCGIYPHGSYEGEIIFAGEEIQASHIRDTERKGIAIIHQELALVKELTVLENIFLGNEITHNGIMDYDLMTLRCQKLLAQVSLSISPDTRVGDLGLGQQQLVEIAKALNKQVRLLILDEPTASLTEQETSVLLDIIRDLQQHGIACIYISHKLNEVKAISDTICVIRDGQHIGTRDAAGMSEDDIITMMVGRELTAIIVLGAIWLLNDYRGVPTPVLLLTLLLLGGMFMATRTAFGRRIYAIGGNLEAARLSGINVERTKLAVFAINGLMVAIAGLILSSRLGAGSPSAGNIAELDAIAACVIGGTSLAGGVGSVAGAVMGAFIMASLDNGMSMMDVPTFWQYIVKGAILLLAVWMDSATKRRS
ncbi:TPA: ATP-binding cassette domain-containing protein [Escherichia coli]|nr:ATP-binding cassette domain-containing protein [Escherichia coli]